MCARALPDVLRRVAVEPWVVTVRLNAQRARSLILHDVEVYRGMSKEIGRLKRVASTHIENSIVVSEKHTHDPSRVTLLSFLKR